MLKQFRLQYTKTITLNFENTFSYQRKYSLIVLLWQFHLRQYNLNIITILQGFIRHQYLKCCSKWSNWDLNVVQSHRSVRKEKIFHHATLLLIIWHTWFFFPTKNWLSRLMIVIMWPAFELYRIAPNLGTRAQLNCVIISNPSRTKGLGVTVT